MERLFFYGRSILAAGVLLCAISSVVRAQDAAATDSLIGYTQFRVNLPGGRHANTATMRAHMVRADGSAAREVAAELIPNADTWTQFAGWSPDGGTAVIGCGWQDPENAAWEEEHKTFRMATGGWTYDMHTLDLPTGKIVNVTAVERVSPYNSGLFYWPNDSAQFGFQALIDGVSHPYRMDRDGRNKVDLSSGADGFTYGFNASSDGKRITYHKNYQIYLADADGSNVVHVETGNPFNFAPTWSPDGQSLVFVSGEHYDCHPHIVRRDGSGLKKIGDRNGYRGVVTIFDVFDFHGGSSDLPVWSPDSQSVIFAKQTGKAGTQLFRTTLDGKTKQLTHSKPGTLNYHPVVHPSGRRVVFGSTRSGTRQIYVLDLESGKVHAVTDVPAGHAAMWPHWQPRPSVTR